MSQGEQKNDDSDLGDYFDVEMENHYKFQWFNDGTIQTMRDLLERLFDDYVPETLQFSRGEVLQLKGYRSDKILQEWDITKQIDDAISFEDWFTRFGNYLSFTISHGAVVFLNGEFKCLWKESDNIRSVRSLVQFLGIDWKNSSTTLKLWEEAYPEQIIILKEENMDNPIIYIYEHHPHQGEIYRKSGHSWVRLEPARFRVDVLNDSEIVADLADQMRSITMNSTTRDERRRETERERDDREHRRNENEDDIIEGLRQMRLEGTDRPSRKRKVLPLKLRF